MNTFTYYGGSRVRDGVVRPLKAQTFEELVRRYFDSPVPIGMTRQEFLDLPKADRDVIKDVPYITPCTFKHGETKRCDANADKTVLACIDLDPPDIDFGGSDYVSDFFLNPDTIATALEPLSFVAYTTANHKPDRPRLRIIVPVKPCDPSNRYKVVAYLASRLGLPKDFSGSRESMVASQPAYRPVIFSDEDSSIGGLLAARTSGTDLDASTIADEEPAPETFAAEGMDDCGLENLPTFGLSVEDIRQALFTISPDVGYKQWTEIASALRHQFRSEDEAREAYDLFDEWSATGTKYRGEKDTKAKWRSFRPDPTGKNPITIRSLFHHAKQAGWRPEKTTEDLGRKLEEWMQAQTDPHTLGSEGPARIAAFPLKDAITEARLIDKLRENLRRLGSPITVTTASKAIKQAKTRAKIESDRKELPGWLRPWVFVATSGEFINRVSGVRLAPVNFNLNFAQKLMPDETDSELAKVGMPAVQPVNFALNVHEIDRVEQTLYDPRPETPAIFDYKGVRYLNEYRPDTIPVEDPSKAEFAMEVFQTVVDNVFGEEAEIAMQFFAYLVQKPGHKIRWCFCVQSAQGAGKSLIAGMIGAAIGDTNVIPIEPNLIRADFNDWIYGKQLIVFEEIYVQGERRAAIMDKLKTVISNDELTLNEKNRNARKILNFANALAFTNHHDALYLEESDRRYAAVRSPIQTRKDVLRLQETGIFATAGKVVREHGGALRHALLNYPIPSSFDPNSPPKTKARDELVEASKNRLQIAIEELIEGDNPLIGDDIILATEVTRLTETESRNNHKPSHFLAVLGYERYNSGKRYTVNGYRSAIWVHRENYDPCFGLADEILGLRAQKLFDDL